MNISKETIRTCLLYEYKLGTNASETSRKICCAFGQDTLSRTTASRWYNKFNNNDFSLQDEARSGRPVEIDLDRLQQLITADPRLTTRCLSSMLGCCHVTIANHLHQLGKVLKLGVWIPHELNAKQLLKRVDVCEQLLSKRRNINWLDNLITGDEKWVMYVNHTRKRQWLEPGKTPLTTPKPDLHPQKVMLSVWWDVEGVIYWELLPPNTTITAHTYCTQLQNLAAEYKKKRPGRGKTYFLHDNARPHIAESTQGKLSSFDWEVLPHPPYSPDLAPTDYHLFLSLSNSLREKNFNNEESLKEYLDIFFKSKPREFYSSGIRSLAKRWQHVIDSNSAYVINY